MRLAFRFATIALLAATGVSGQVWRVQEAPEFSIGSVDVGEEYTLPGVQGAWVLENGTTAVVSYRRGFFRIRYYDTNGEHLTSAGRSGPGPWEVGAWVGAVRLPGDSIMVLSDFNRGAVFGPKGERVRAWAWDPGHWLHGVRLIDRRHIAGWVSAAGSAKPPAEGLRRDTLILVVFDMHEDRLDTVARVPAVRYYADGDGGSRDSPFSPNAHYAAGHGWLWFGSSDGDRIHGVAPSRDSAATIRLVTPVREVEASHRSQYDAWVSRGRRRPPSHRPDFPDVFPRFQDIQMDGEGNLWVRRYSPPYSTGDQLWDVYDPSHGRRIAVVTVPGSLLSPCDRVWVCPAVLDIGADFMLRLSLDRQWGFMKVQKHRLIK